MLTGRHTDAPGAKGSTRSRRRSMPPEAIQTLDDDQMISPQCVHEKNRWLSIPVASGFHKSQHVARAYSSRVNAQ